MLVYLAKNIEDATRVSQRAKKRGFSVISIEAEWGNDRLKDVDVELSHHGVLSDNECPSIMAYRFIDKIKDKNRFYICSHIDLDVLIAILQLERSYLLERDDFRKIMEMTCYADRYGYVSAKCKFDNNSNEWKKFITMGFICNRNNRISAGKFISKKVKLLIRGLERISIEPNISNSVLYKNEAKWWEENKTKNAEKYLVEASKYCHYFSGPGFKNNNYYIKGILAPFVINYNKKHNKITVSCISEEIAKKIFGEEGLIKVVKHFFGEEAGGRPAIAGSPRDKKIDENIAFLLKFYIENAIILKGEDAVQSMLEQYVTCK